MFPVCVVGERGEVKRRERVFFFYVGKEGKEGKEDGGEKTVFFMVSKPFGNVLGSKLQKGPLFFLITIGLGLIIMIIKI